MESAKLTDVNMTRFYFLAWLEKLCSMCQLDLCDVLKPGLEYSPWTFNVLGVHIIEIAVRDEKQAETIVTVSLLDTKYVFFVCQLEEKLKAGWGKSRSCDLCFYLKAEDILNVLLSTFLLLQHFDDWQHNFMFKPRKTIWLVSYVF